MLAKGEEIVISRDIKTWTNGSVTIEVKWPNAGEGIIKQISINGGNTWSEYTAPVSVHSNCEVKARMIDSAGNIGEVKSLTIDNIDPNNPIVTATNESVTIIEGNSYALSKYFTANQNGNAPISTTVYTDTSNEDKQVTNTSALVEGTHIIKCTVTKESGAIGEATITVIVENQLVDGKGLARKQTTIKPSSSNDVQIVLPKGFGIAILEGSETTESNPGQSGKVTSIMHPDNWGNITVEQINKGIVVVNNGITYDGGNVTGTVPDFEEYIWVPVPDSSNFVRKAWTIGSNTSAQVLAETSTASASWEDKTTTQYKNMVSSVSNYKGFYIGRYEASQQSSTVAQSKRGQTVWVNITHTDAITYSANNEISNSHLIYGIEWDTTLNWLIGNATINSSTSGSTKTMTLADIQTNSSSWGNYSDSTGSAATNNGTRKVTGNSEYWKANNIYDLAGNVEEWTQESYSTGNSKNRRSGYYGVSGSERPTAFRHSLNASTVYGSLGFRISFYLEPEIKITPNNSSLEILEGASKTFNSLFTVTTATGSTTGITKTYTLNSKTTSYTNTNQLEEGKHVLSCTATYNGLSDTATMTLVVKNAQVDDKGLARNNTIIKPSSSSNVQIVLPKGFGIAILQGSGTTTSNPGQNGKVKSIMHPDDWDSITVNQINQGIVVVNNSITYDGGEATGTVPDFEEFVWIPCPESSAFSRVAWKSYTRREGSDKIEEHPLASSRTYMKFWETVPSAMVSSVTRNLGFYVGRYECSKAETGEAVSKRGLSPWGTVTLAEAMKGATDNAITNTHLMYGIEFDSTLNWLIGKAKIVSSDNVMTYDDVCTSSEKWGNLSNSTGNAANGSGLRRKTGYSEYWKANNIYDLAGNMNEWTQENYWDSYAEYVVERGGACDWGSPFIVAAGRFEADSSKVYGDRRF